jgi:hypothetical protein
MKNKLMFYLMVVILLITIPNLVFAGFRIKERQAISFSHVHSGTQVESHKNKTGGFINKLSGIVYSGHAGVLPERRNRNTNIGLVSMIFGIAAFCVPLGMVLGIPAIIMGATGIKRHEKYARAGLILGIVSTALSLFEIIIFIAIVSLIG